MKDKGGIAFRRLVRNTTSNREWVRDMLSELAECPNVSIAVLDDTVDNQEMPMALSVQTVDSSHSWLVAVAGHERRGDARDLRIDDEVVTEFIQAYFDRLWDKAEIIKDNGILTTAGQQLVEEA